MRYPGIKSIKFNKGKMSFISLADFQFDDNELESKDKFQIIGINDNVQEQ